MDAAIHLISVSKTYRTGVKALRGLAMQVGQGEIFGLLGPNGAGKSTLLRILLRLVHATECRGTMLGQPIGHVETLRRVGYLPEHVQYAPHLTPLDLIDLAGRLTGVPSAVRIKRGRQLLEAVGMERWRNDRLATFSKGMKQRVGLAQALINDPDIVFLDEPTDGVDPVGRKDIRTLMLDLRSRGKTVFVNSHLLGELEMVCDRVAILCRGQVVKDGKISDLTRQQARYTMVVEGDFLLHEGLVALAVSLGGSLALNPDHSHTIITIPSGRPQVVQPLIDEIRKLGAVIESVTPARQTLEELFLDVVLTGGQKSAQQPQPEAQLTHL